VFDYIPLPVFTHTTGMAHFQCLDNFSHITRTPTITHTHTHSYTHICNKTYYVTREEDWMFLKWIML